MEKKIDIIPFLEGIVEENTHHYQTDFDHDKTRLAVAMLEVSQENRTFLWLSRPCGTLCVPERETFIKESTAHITWTHYDYDAEHIKAYRVIVAPGREGDFVLGQIKPLHYGEQVERVKRNAIHAEMVELTFADGTERPMQRTPGAFTALPMPTDGSSASTINPEMRQSWHVSSRKSTSPLPSDVGPRARRNRPPGSTHSGQRRRKAVLSEQVCHLLNTNDHLPGGTAPLEPPAYGNISHSSTLS